MPHRIFALAILALAMNLGATSSTRATASAPPSSQAAVRALPGNIFAANLSSHSVSQHDGNSGESLGDFVASGAGGLVGPTGIAFGPDGDLYVGSSGSNQVLRFDGDTGEPIDVFTKSAIERPFSIIFSPDGDLLVSSRDQILRINPEGQILGEAVVSDKLRQPIGLRFGPENKLYVANSRGDNVLVFDWPSGTLVNEIDSESLRFPSDVDLTPDGRLLVSSAFTRAVHVFDPITGQELPDVAMLPEGSAPVGLALDDIGRVWIADFAANALYRWPISGQLTGALSSTGLAGPENIAIKPREVRDR
ncbi:MAG: hypothetical protein GKS06_13935 [Acidobacteria bacterium]|nr:hypothetical protein [Acidobacteriota bacterium]